VTIGAVGEGVGGAVGEIVGVAVGAIEGAIGGCVLSGAFDAVGTRGELVHDTSVAVRALATRRP
jgi:hypothetical protein